MARRQLADYDRRRPGMLFADHAAEMTVAKAYALQFEVARLRAARGEPLAGYKLGCISPTVQAQLGLDGPVFGHVYITELHNSGAMLNPACFEGLAIEGEFAMRLAEDIADARQLRADPRRAISAAFPVIELHNYVFRNSPHTAQELIGNNAIHAGVVLPPEEPSLERQANLPDAAISVAINNKVRGTAMGGALPGGPVESLVRLVEHLSRFGRTLRRGQIVLTGSLLPLYRVTVGDRIEVAAAGLRVTAGVAVSQEKGSQ